MEHKDQNWRLSIQLTKEQEKALIEMRKKDEYCRMSFGELCRQLIDVGLKKIQGD